MIRDTLAARLAEMEQSGASPDYQRLALEVLGIRGAPSDLARRLVEQALVVEDRRDNWRRVGDRVCSDAPHAAGVYVFRDANGGALYVGKAANLRRRLGAHFSDRRWRTLHPAVARVAHVEWQTTGSELEALLREAILITEMQPVANVQIGAPALRTRALPATLVRDVVVLVPSVDPDSVDLVAARVRGDVMIERADRSGATLSETTARLSEFFDQTAETPRTAARLALAPLVFSWIAGRGRHATRFDPHDVGDAGQFTALLASLFSDTSLFVERLVTLR
jgi:predicted GIY-YIG superfamily endonuclease